MGLIYLTIKKNESLKEFIRRIKFEVRGDVFTKEVSPVMGRGIQVLTLIKENTEIVAKIEIDFYDTEELLKTFPKVSYIKSSYKKSHRRKDGLGNIEDIL